MDDVELLEALLFDLGRFDFDDFDGVHFGVIIDVKGFVNLGVLALSDGIDVHHEIFLFLSGGINEFEMLDLLGTLFDIVLDGLHFF